MLVVIDLGLAVVGVLVYGLLRNQYISLDRLRDDECMEDLGTKTRTNAHYGPTRLGLLERWLCGRDGC